MAGITPSKPDCLSSDQRAFEANLPCIQETALISRLYGPSLQQDRYCSRTYVNGFMIVDSQATSTLSLVAAERIWLDHVSSGQMRARVDNVVSRELNIRQ